MLVLVLVPEAQLEKEKKNTRKIKEEQLCLFRESTFESSPPRRDQVTSVEYLRSRRVLASGFLPARTDPCGERRRARRAAAAL